MPMPHARLAAFAAAISAALTLAPVASAGKRPAPSTPTTTMTMTSESIQLSSDPQLPTNCLTEDDFDTRYFAGSLAGSYSTSYRLCGLSTDGWTAGGIGLETDAYVSGTLSDVSITAPDGTAHHAVLMGSSTSKGVTTYHYATCYVPSYYLANDAATNFLAGGSWKLTLSGQVSSAYWVTNAQMTNVIFQQTYCPAGEQNLL